MYTERISTAARFNLYSADLQQSQANFDRLTAQLASGKKVQNLTDDPIAAVNIINTNRQLGQLETFATNVELGMKELDTLDDLLSLASGYLSNAWDKAVQANSQTYGVESLKALKVEIDQITKTMVDLANTEYNKTTRLFRYDLNLIPYDYTVEVTNRFKGLGLIECLKNYGQRFVTLYRRQKSRPSPRKRCAKWLLRSPYKQL